MLQRSLEIYVEFHFQRLVLIVLGTLVGLSVETLFAVEQVRGLIPGVTHLLDIKGVLVAVFLDENLAGSSGLADGSVGNAGLVEEVLHGFDVAVLHLNHHTGILGHQVLYDILTAETAQVDIQTAFRVGKGHL